MKQAMTAMIASGVDSINSWPIFHSKAQMYNVAFEVLKTAVTKTGFTYHHEEEKPCHSRRMLLGQDRYA